jgi:hypothetical protein
MTQIRFSSFFLLFCFVVLSGFLHLRRILILSFSLKPRITSDSTGALLRYFFVCYVNVKEH